MQKTEVSLNPTDIMFLDIETVKIKTWEDLTPRQKGLWVKRFDYEIIKELAKATGGKEYKEDYFPEELEAYAKEIYNNKAALFAEYGKIACCGVGYIKANADGVMFLTTKCIISPSEVDVLNEIARTVASPVAKVLLAHNGKEFDFPYITRRMLINDIQIPWILNTMGKKPWEVNLLDTMELWKFTSLRHSISLDQLAEVFGLPSPKETMDGKDVEKLFVPSGEGLPFEDEAIRHKKIADYCVGDVITMVNCFLKMQGKPIILPENIIRK